MVGTSGKEMYLKKHLVKKKRMKERLPHQLVWKRMIMMIHRISHLVISNVR